MLKYPVTMLLSSFGRRNFDIIPVCVLNKLLVHLLHITSMKNSAVLLVPLHLLKVDKGCFVLPMPTTSRLTLINLPWQKQI